jgi:hypothetical protein
VYILKRNGKKGKVAFQEKRVLRFEIFLGEDEKYNNDYEYEYNHYKGERKREEGARTIWVMRKDSGWTFGVLSLVLRMLNIIVE